jgi:hypothetical protein
VLLIAGEPNAAVHELWKAKAWPSFGKADGKRRLRDLAEQMKPVIVDGQERSAIYPGDDLRVIRALSAKSFEVCLASMAWNLPFPKPESGLTH